jgi:hypothetical protein
MFFERFVGRIGHYQVNACGWDGAEPFDSVSCMKVVWRNGKIQRLLE